MTMSDPKKYLQILGLCENVRAEDILSLLNMAVDFVDKFLKLQNQFIAVESSEDSTGTMELEEDEQKDQEQRDEYVH